MRSEEHRREVRGGVWMLRAKDGRPPAGEQRRRNRHDKPLASMVRKDAFPVGSHRSAGETAQADYPALRFLAGAAPLAFSAGFARSALTGRFLSVLTASRLRRSASMRSTTLGGSFSSGATIS